MHVKDLLSLKGKIVLVTGGAGMYGRCIVEALAEAGGTVITASRKLKPNQIYAAEAKSLGLDVHAMQVDQASHESVMTLKVNIENKFHGLDVFVNNAVSRPMKAYEDPLSCWQESMSVNATGMFDILREMADLIAKRGGGTIVNISSMLGMFGPDFSNYEGSNMDSPADYNFHKGGLISLTHYLARRFACNNIRVNCLSPGGLRNDGMPKPFIEKYCSKVPLGRLAEHDDIKGAVVFLASRASSYITGINILMDGGMHA